MNGNVYSEDDDDGYDSSCEDTLTKQGGNRGNDVEFSPLTVDEQIAAYEQLHDILYPNKRLQEIAARNSHLRQTVYFPSAVQDKPRTEQEKQWMKEHSRPLYKLVDDTTMDVDRQSGRRQTLHESFLSHRDSVASTPGTARSKERGKSLAEIANPDAFRQYDDCNTKSKILRSLNSRPDLTLNKQSGSRSQRY